MLITSGTVRHEVEPIGTVTLPAVHDYRHERSQYAFSDWLFIPLYIPQPVPDLTRVLNRLVDRTGWSNRRIAGIVGTTHPTIQAIKSGRDPERRPDLAEALYNAAEVVEKISRLALGNQATLKSVLSNRGQGDTPLHLLAAGEYAKAYLRALDLISKPRQTVSLLNAIQARQPSEDIGLISDDSDE
jgi:hypothetical protein